MQLVFEQIRAGGDRNFGCREAKQAVLIDPSYSPDVFVDRAGDQGMTVTHVVNTHGHTDHVNGNERALERTGARLAAHPALAPDVPLGDGDEAAATWHGEERARLESIGQTPPFVDGQIAAIAKVHGLTVVTTNDRDFSGFKGLAVEDWSKGRARSRARRT